MTAVVVPDVVADADACDGPHVAYEACTVLDLIERQALAAPAAVAVLEDAAALDYAALWRRSAHVAAGLRAAGQRPGRIVAVLMPRGIDWIVALLGVMRAGCVYLPLNAKNPVERNRRIVEQAGVGGIVGPGLQDLPGRTLALAALEADGADHAAVTTPRAPADDAYCIYTSGSTGEPKGIRLSHGAFANFIQACPAVFDSGHLVRPRHLQFCEPSFDVHIFEVFHPLSRGGAIVIDPRPDFVSFEAYVERIERQRVDIISPPTTFWHLWRSHIDEGRSRWPRGLTHIVVGGEMAQPARFSRRGMPPGLVLMNGYGPAETNYATVHMVGESDDDSSTLPVGRPLPNLSIHILDDDRRPLPRGQVGEIGIAGAGVASGYVAATAADQARFATVVRADGRRQRLYCTGDLGRLDAHGTLVCLGRRDDQVKIQGVRVELGDIEAQVLAFAAVKAAIVLALDDGQGDRQLALVLQLHAPPPGHPAAVAALVARLQAELPAYMVPRHWAAIDEWPLTANGKVDRRRLGALALQLVPMADAGQQPDAGPSDAAVIAQLTRLWQQVRRNADPVPPHALLQRLEPSSLRIGMFFAEVFDHFDLDVPPETFFGLQTLADVAHRLQALQPSQPAASPLAD